MRPISTKVLGAGFGTMVAVLNNQQKKIKRHPSKKIALMKFRHYSRVILTTTSAHFLKWRICITSL